MDNGFSGENSDIPAVLRNPGEVRCLGFWFHAEDTEAVFNGSLFFRKLLELTSYEFCIGFYAEAAEISIDSGSPKSRGQAS